MVEAEVSHHTITLVGVLAAIVFFLAGIILGPILLQTQTVKALAQENARLQAQVDYLGPQVDRLQRRVDLIEARFRMIDDQLGSPFFIQGTCDVH